MIDTHAHLDPPEAQEVLDAGARRQASTRVVTVATTLEGGREALELAAQNEGVFAALGIHPHNAAGEDAQRIDELRELLRDDRAVAVGETGLDYFRDYAPARRPAPARSRRSSASPTSSASRSSSTRAPPTRTPSRCSRHSTGTVVLHCFSSTALLEPALERGWYVSFAGNVTYPKAPELRAAARLVPADRLLAETDSPYLAPQPVRGRANEPAFVMHTLAALAAGAGRGRRRARAAQIDANADRRVRAVNVVPKKALGQHFLVDENILGVIGAPCRSATPTMSCSRSGRASASSPATWRRGSRTCTRSSSTARSSPSLRDLEHTDLHWQDALALDARDARPPAGKARREPAVQHRDAVRRREPRPLPGDRACGA